MLDIVVPVFNEGDNIEKLLDEVGAKVKVPCRVMVVYDFDEDNTLPVVRALQGRYPFEILLQKNIYQRGALYAIKTGLTQSGAEAVVVTMADLSDSLETVNEMYRLFGEGYALVCGSRYMKGGSQEGGPLLKSLFSRLAGVSLHLLTRIPTRDVTNSFKLYSKQVRDRFTIESTGGFELGMELTVKAFAAGLPIAETPAHWIDRVAGESNFKMWAWIPKYLHWYFYAIKSRWFGWRGK